MKVLSLFLRACLQSGLALTALARVASATPHFEVSTCIGAYCTTDGSAFTQLQQSGFFGTNDPYLNAALRAARSGCDAGASQRAAANLDRHYQESLAQVGTDAAKAQEVYANFAAMIESTEKTAQSRRVSDPLSETHSPSEIASRLPAVGALANAVDRFDPLAAAEQTRAVLHLLDPKPGTDVVAYGVTRGDLSKHLRTRYFNEFGLLKGFVYANRPGMILQTPWLSDSGIRIREGMNRVFASEEVIETLCRAPESSSGQALGACQTLRDHLSELRTAAALADQFIASGRSELAESILTGFESAAKFQAAFTNQLLREAVYLGAGMALAAYAPAIATVLAVGTVAAAVGYAITHYDRTHEIVVRTAREFGKVFLSGSAEERGHVSATIVAAVAGLLLSSGSSQAVQAALLPGIELAVTREVGLIAVGNAHSSNLITQAAASGLKETISALPTVVRNLAASEASLIQAGAWSSAVTASMGKALETAALGGAGEVLKKAAVESPAAFLEIGKALASSSDPKALGGYLARLPHNLASDGSALYGDISQYGRLAKQYVQFEAQLRAAFAETTFEQIQVMRAIPRNIQLENGVTRELTEADVFFLHERNLITANRFDMAGIPGLNTSVGPNARETILREMNSRDGSELVFASRKVMGNFLDLSDDSWLLDKLNFKAERLVVPASSSPSAYELPQVLGYIAYSLGYDGVIFKSAVAAPNGVNALIFNLEVLFP